MPLAAPVTTQILSLTCIADPVLAMMVHLIEAFARRCGNGSALPLPPNSGLSELGISNCRSRIYPTSIGRGLGRGVTVYRYAVTPLPDRTVDASHRRFDPTAPTRGEVSSLQNRKVHPWYSPLSRACRIARPASSSSIRLDRPA